MAYRWFAWIPIDTKVPDHSSMTKTRDRFGKDLYQALFDKIIEQCIKIGLLSGERLMTDASLFESNASPMSLVKIDNKVDFDSEKERATERKSGYEKAEFEYKKGTSANETVNKKSCGFKNSTHEH